MRRKSKALLVAVCIVVPGLAACGGGSQSSTHTYVQFSDGVDLTIVSPAAIPTGFLTNNGEFPLLSKPRGPQVCSYTKTVVGGRGPEAILNGKTLTLKVNGPKRFASRRCKILKKRTPINAVAFQPFP
jgi:hypothetical protein